jgi:hypothetical protein
MENPESHPGPALSLTSDGILREADPDTEAESTPKLWTQADYINQDYMNCDSIEEMIDGMLNMNAPFLGSTPNAVTIHNDAISLLREALIHLSPVVSLNLHVLAYSIFQNYTEIDDNYTLSYWKEKKRGRIADSGVAVKESMEAKMRFLDFMNGEARRLRNTDMENFLLYVKGIVEFMMEMFSSTKNEEVERGYKVGQWRNDPSRGL